MPTKQITATMSRRTKAQMEQLAAVHAMRRQEGGADPSGPALEEALAVKTAELKAANTALDYAKGALEDTRLELEHEREHSASLYNSLRVVRHKQQRTQVAKVAALEKAMSNMALVDQIQAENEALVDQLQAENEALEHRISELLQNSKYSEEQQQEAKRKIRALQMRCMRASDFIDTQLEMTKGDWKTVSLMEKVFTQKRPESCAA